MLRGKREHRLQHQHPLALSLALSLGFPHQDEDVSRYRVPFLHGFRREREEMGKRTFFRRKKVLNFDGGEWSTATQ